MRVWQFIKNGVCRAVRVFFRPLLHIVARPKHPPSTTPGELSPHDFEVPLRDIVLRRLEVWGPVLIMLLAGVVMFVAVWWLNTR